MSDIFISYAREDRSRVAALARLLETNGWSVWWDPVILPGETWDEVIEDALHAARCVVVVWTKTSVRKKWVRVEAADGEGRGILVPVLMEADVVLPLRFRQIQAARLIDWQGDGQHPGLTHLLAAITAKVGHPATPPRPDVKKEKPRPEGRPLPPTFTNRLGIRFVLIPAGSFEMGSEKGRDNEKPVHRVTISRPFYLGVYAVTQGPWKQVMGTEPWKGQSYVQEGSDYPAVYVSWDDAQAFIEKLNAQDAENRYRLPTEAEWEYACRAGSTTEYCFADDTGKLGDYAWYRENTINVGERYMYPVGQKKPNAWGLYDVHGNVWEWVADRYGVYPSEPVTDPNGPATGSRRVLRGGSWGSTAGGARSACRVYDAPGHRSSSLGFRLVRMAR